MLIELSEKRLFFSLSVACFPGRNAGGKELQNVRNLIQQSDPLAMKSTKTASRNHNLSIAPGIGQGLALLYEIFFAAAPKLVLNRNRYDAAHYTCNAAHIYYPPAPRGPTRPSNHGIILTPPAPTHPRTHARVARAGPARRPRESSGVSGSESDSLAGKPGSGLAQPGLEGGTWSDMRVTSCS